MITGEELAAYAAGEADPAVVARVESALPDDPALAARLDRLRRVDDLLGELGPITMTPAEEARLQAAVDRDLADLAAPRAGTEAGSEAGGGVAGGEVVDLASRRAASASGRRSARDWFDPARLAGVAAALVVVVGIGAIVLNGSGLSGSDDGAESADLAAAPGEETATAARSEAMLELPSASEEALGAGAEAATESTEAATEAGETATAVAPDSSEIPVVDTQRVVPRAADIDPVELRQRLQPLVELDALEEAAEDGAAEVSEPPSSAVGIADGRVVAADREAVASCLPTDAADVIVAEVIVLAPDRPAIAYVLDRRVVVVDATTCATIAQLSG